MKSQKQLMLLIFLFIVIIINAQSYYPGQFEDKFSVPNIAITKAQAFELSDVRLLDSRFKDNMQLNSNWVLSLPVKSLLHSFRTNAGTFSGYEGGYLVIPKLGGWESLDCDLRGHTTGHILSSLALFYASSGENAYKIKADSIVNGLSEVQKTLGSTGYLSAFPEGLIDRNIQGKSVWAPWYTLHKIYAGLIDQYLYCDNHLAFEIVTKMSDWAYNKLSGIDDATRRRMIRNEFGGMNEVFYNMYALTGNQKYSFLAEFFYHNDMIDPLHEDKDELAGKHANTFIPKLLGEARNFELFNKTRSKLAAKNFWKNVTNNHSFCVGCNSSKEKFFDSQKMSQFITGYTGETCNAYNMLKLSHHLFCWDASVEIAEFYERALFNHISGQQDPATGMVSYFLPMMSGAHKVYSTERNSFWCCVGTGFESHAKYNEAIYYKNSNAIYINLFIPSIVKWSDKNIEITQMTSFPENGKTKLLVSEGDGKNNFKIMLRYPSWATYARVAVNGRKIAINQDSGSYIILNRKWKKNDVVLADFGMELRLCTTTDNPDKAAIMYGPIVLAGEKGSDGFIEKAPYSNPVLHNDYYTYNYNVPENLDTDLKLDRSNLSGSIKKNRLDLIFTTNEGYVLKPLYLIHRQRYVVYWDLKDK